jgi:predicted nucleotidyltransferase
MEISLSRLVEQFLESGLNRQAKKEALWEARLGVDREQVAALCKAVGVKRLQLFGSALTDKFRPDSDVDLLVEFKPGIVESLLDWGRVHMEFQELFGRDVDLVDPKMITNPYRRRHIMQNQLEIYSA